MKIVLDLKVVMDTNVFVSGVFFSGPPYQILKAWQSGEFLVVSQEILDEYRRAAQDHQGFPDYPGDNIANQSQP